MIFPALAGAGSQGVPLTELSTKVGLGFFELSSTLEELENDGRIRVAGAPGSEYVAVKEIAS